MNKDVATIDNSELNQQTSSPMLAENADSMTSACTNCGVDLNGKFCHSCGQSSNSMIKFFGDVAKDLLDDAFGYDSRLKHSIFPLLFKPGRITLDYVKGKRFHYVLPFKLYLITSVLFILLIKNVIDTDNIKLTGIDGQELSPEVSQEIKKDVDNALSELKDTEHAQLADEISQQINQNIGDVGDIPESRYSGQFNLCGEEQSVNIQWDNELKQFHNLDKLQVGLCKTFITAVNPKLKGWIENPKHLINSIIELLPYMMFIMLPIFAIFLKMFYVFSKRFYTEHLVFLLHNHSFVFMLLMIQISFDYFENKLIGVQHWSAQLAESILSFTSLILSFWLIIYVFIAMKRFYRQGWGLTILKATSLGFVYTMMLSFGFVLALAIGAYKA